MSGADGTAPLPPGDYAIVEVLGHRTYVGRVGEVERFGTKFMSVEPLFDGRLLPAVLVGGSSVYQFTPVTAAVAAEKQPRERWELPASVAVTPPPEALRAPDAWSADDDEAEFAPDFLNEEISHG